MRKPGLTQLVTIRDSLALGHTFDNMALQENGQITFIRNGRLHMIDVNGTVHISEWVRVATRHDLAAEYREKNQ